MSKILIPLLGVLAVIWLWRHQRAPRVKRQRTRRAVNPTRMIRCAHCGLHVPHDTALTDNSGHAYCCKAHLQEGRRE